MDRTTYSQCWKHIVRKLVYLGGHADSVIVLAITTWHCKCRDNYNLEKTWFVNTSNFTQNQYPFYTDDRDLEDGVRKRKDQEYTMGFAPIIQISKESENVCSEKNETKIFQAL